MNEKNATREGEVRVDVAPHIDLQVNGYAGIDFNSEDLTLEEMRRACDQLYADGTEAIVATIITDTIAVMSRKLQRLVKLRKQDERIARMVVGLHIEGPFISAEAGYRGAHPVDAIRPANMDAMKQLLDAADGLTRIVTLAPECDEGLATTRFLADQGVVVSAGHCNPSLEQLDAAIDAGLSMFTHLGNGCPMQMHRHDNIVQRVLARADKLWLCFIADHVHIPPPALANYLQLAGDRAIVVSDAMAAAGLGPGRYRISRWDLVVGEDLAAWAPDRAHLVGSAMSLRQMQQILATQLSLDADHIDALTRERPAQILGLL